MITIKTHSKTVEAETTDELYTQACSMILQEIDNGHCAFPFAVIEQDGRPIIVVTYDQATNTFTIA